MHDYKKLQVWTEAVDLAVEIYKLTDKFPKDERFGLISQLRRSAVSVPSNIAEGAGRNSNGEFKQFLGIANGSSYEMETQLIISEKLSYINKAELEVIQDKVIKGQKKIYNLKNKLK